MNGMDEVITKLGEKLQAWLDAFILNLPNIAAALLVLLLAWLAAALLRRATERVVLRVSHSEQISHLIAYSLYFVVLMIGAFFALGTLGAEKTVTSLLAGAGILGLALGLAFQALGENFVAGVYLALRRPFRVGDWVSSGEHTGLVEHQDLRTTWIRVPQGQLVLIPNKEIFTNPLINFSDRKLRRVDLPVGVTYDADLEKVQTICIEAVQPLDATLPDQPVQCYFAEFGDSSINCVVRFWIRFEREVDFQAARSAAVIAIKQAFDRNGITIPFPIRTLDFGRVGGETLLQVLQQAGVGNRPRG